MKKLVIFLLLTIFSACNNPAEDLSSIHLNDYSSATLTYGDGENKRIKNQDALKRLVKIIQKAELKKSSDQEKVKGYHFFVRLIGENPKEITFLGDRLEVGNIYYHIPPTLSDKNVESLFKK